MGDGLGRDGIGVAIAEYPIVHPCLLIEFICNPGRVCFRVCVRVSFCVVQDNLILLYYSQGTGNGCKAIYSY